MIKPYFEIATIILFYILLCLLAIKVILNFKHSSKELLPYFTYAVSEHQMATVYPLFEKIIMGANLNLEVKEK